MKKRWMLIVMLCVALLLAGCVTIEESPTTKLSIRNIQLCSHVSDSGDYTIQPAATFDRGHIAWTYWEAHGITLKKTDSVVEFWVKCSEFKLFNPDGEVVGHLVDWLELHETDISIEEAPTFVWFCMDYNSTIDDLVGEYRAEFKVTDVLSGATGEGSATFTLQ